MRVGFIEEHAEEDRSFNARVDRPCAMCGDLVQKGKTTSARDWSLREYIYCDMECKNLGSRNDLHGYLSRWIAFMGWRVFDFWSVMKSYSTWNMARLRWVMYHGIKYKADGELPELGALRLLCAFYSMEPSLKKGEFTFDYRMLLAKGRLRGTPKGFETTGKCVRSELAMLLKVCGIKDFVDRYCDGKNSSLRVALMDWEGEIDVLYGTRRDVEVLKRVISRKAAMTSPIAKEVSEFLDREYDVQVDYRMLLRRVSGDYEELKEKYKVEGYW